MQTLIFANAHPISEGPEGHVQGIAEISYRLEVAFPVIARPFFFIVNATQ